MKNSILDELEFETGHLSYKNVRYLFIRPEVVISLHKQVEAELGPEKCAQIVSAAGNVGGDKSSRRFKEVFGYSEQEIVEFMCKMGGEIGWGIFSLQRLDIDRGEIVIEVRDSPFAAAYGPSDSGVCHLIRGVLSGMGAGTFGREVVATETTCTAKGDPICRFLIRLAE